MTQALLDFSEGSYWLNLYLTCKKNYWVPESVSLQEDKNQWEAIEPELKKHVLELLQYAISLDTYQIGNIASFCTNSEQNIIQALLSYHTLMESIHAESYSYYAKSVMSLEEKRKLFELNENTINRMANHAFLSKKAGALVGNYYLEGVSFQLLFKLSDFLKSKELLPGLSATLNLIKRDELVHIATFQRLIEESQIKVENFAEEFMSAAKIEAQYALKLMGQDFYWSLLSTAQQRLIALGYKPKEIIKDPLASIAVLNDQTKTSLKQNFFTSSVVYSAVDSQLSWDPDDWF